MSYGELIGRRVMSRSVWRLLHRRWRNQRRENGSWVTGWMIGDLLKYQSVSGYVWCSQERFSRFIAVKCEASRPSDVPF